MTRKVYDSPSRLLLASLFLVAACGGAGASGEELSSAADRLRPRLTEVEMDEFIEDCLEDEGVVAFVRQPDGNGFIGERVTDRDQKTMEDCQEKLFAEYGTPGEPRTDADFMVLYRLYEKQAACLRNLGLTVEIPSFETYREGSGEWVPYRDLPVPTSQEEWDTWNAQCPQDPWTYEEHD